MRDFYCSAAKIWGVLATSALVLSLVSHHAEPILGALIAGLLGAAVFGTLAWLDRD